MGEGKKDAATHRLTGRAEDNRLVHFEVPAGSDLPRPGDVVSVVVTHAAPFHLLADAPDGAPLRIRRTRAGDAWDRTQAESCGIPAPAGRAGGAEGRVARPAHAPHRRVSAQTRRGRPRLWAIVGATGTGKTSLSLDLAEALAARGSTAEIVNADAMQLYRGMDIGTAKLPIGERRGIPHHLLDVLDVTEEAAVAWYQDAARAAIDDIHRRGADAILVGGSGLYVSSVIFDFRFPPHDDALRAELEAELEAAGPRAAVRPAARGRPRHRGADRSEERPPDRPRARGARAGRGDPRRGAAGRARPVARRPHHRGRRAARARRRLDAGSSRCGRRILDETASLRERGSRRRDARRAIGYAQALAQLAGEDRGRGDRRDAGAHPRTRGGRSRGSSGTG